MNPIQSNPLVITKYNLNKTKYNKDIYNLVYMIKKSDLHRFINVKIIQQFIKSKETTFVKRINREKTIRKKYSPIITTSTSYLFPIYIKNSLVDFLQINDVESIKWKSTVESKKPTKYQYEFVTDIWTSKQNLIDDVYNMNC